MQIWSDLNEVHIDGKNNFSLLYNHNLHLSSLFSEMHSQLSIYHWSIYLPIHTSTHPVTAFQSSNNIFFPLCTRPRAEPETGLREPVLHPREQYVPPGLGPVHLAPPSSAGGSKAVWCGADRETSARPGMSSPHVAAPLTRVTASDSPSAVCVCGHSTRTQGSTAIHPNPTQLELIPQHGDSGQGDGER